MDKDETIIFLVRHGQAKYNKFLGRKKTSIIKDSDLTNLGEKQSLKISDYLKQFEIDKVYSSTTKSAIQTAKIIIQSNPLPLVSYTNKFRELRLGNELNDNFDFYSSLKIYLQNWRKGKDIRLKGGENFKDLINRAIPFLKELIKRNRGKKLVIVTHQTVIQAIIGYYRKLPFVRMVNELNIKCGQIFIIKFSRDNKVYIKLIGLT